MEASLPGQMVVTPRIDMHGLILIYMYMHVHMYVHLYLYVYSLCFNTNLQYPFSHPTSSRPDR